MIRGEMIKKLVNLASISLLFSTLYIGTSIAKTTITLDKEYLKVGIGVMKFEKFKETGGGLGYIKKAPKVSPVYNIGIGYRFSDSIRTDLNLQYSEVKYKAGDLKQNIKTTAVFVNGYYDINFYEKLVPYLTAGIGVGINAADALKETDGWSRKGKTKTNFAWNVGLGMWWNINKSFAVDLGYKYMDLGNSRTTTAQEGAFEGGKQKIRGHRVLGSLIYNF